MVRRLSWILAVLCLGAACTPGNYAPEAVADALLKAAPGDTIRIRDGVYDGLDLHWKASASAESPIVVTAQTPGGVILKGKSSLHISGRGLTVQNLLLRGCTADKGALIEFKDGDSLATECRLTECVMEDCNPVRRNISYSYIHLYGRGNRVDHCSLLGKKNLGVTLIVMLNYDGCDENGHRIDHNWFGPRPVYGSNGAETMRVGTSQQCMQNSRTQITDNLFDRCNGEVEVVSIKSCENTIARNTFYECQGVLALRHGDRNTAEDNLFIGHGIRNTGGIRIVGEDQTVRGNTFLGLAGERFFSALALMYGVPNSLPNRYMQVKRTVIEGNDFQACRSIDFRTGEDFERTLPPVETVWKDNRESPVQTACEPSFEALADGKGASWYTVSAEAPAPVKEIVLKDSLYVLEEALRIDGPTVIRAEAGAHPEVIFAGDKTDNMITLCDGADLTVQGIRFSGRLTPGKRLAKSIISTDTDMIEPYKLRIEDCAFSDCGEGGFVPVRGLKGTFADSVVIRRCSFSALSGDGINFAGETEDKGVYNADDILIEDCTFERILGIPVHIARNGSDESTAGPYVFVRDCRFVDCCNKVRGSVLRIIGAQVLDISGCSFTDSGRGGYSIRLDEAPWEKVTLRGLTFQNSGKVLSNRKLY